MSIATTQTETHQEKKKKERNLKIEYPRAVEQYSRG